MTKALAAALAVLTFAPAAVASPRVAIFYYPWYGTPARDGGYVHWNQADHSPPQDIASRYYPARGAYSSSNPAVVAAQMDDLRTAHVGEVVVSWWGRGSAEDARLALVTNAARERGIDVAVHVEPYPGRTIETVAADIAYLRALGIDDFYVYEPREFTAAEWLPLTASVVGARLFAETARVGFAAQAGFSGVYTYDIVTYGGWMFRRFCGEAHAAHLLCAPSVGPGFDSSAISATPEIKPRRGGRTYDRMWTAALRSSPDLVTITSYNEWGEGTQIEPAGCGRGLFPYRNYDGTYGLRGRAAEHAYVRRTAYWVNRFVPRSVMLPRFSVASTKPEAALGRSQGWLPWQGRGWTLAPRDRGREAGKYRRMGH